MCRRLRRPAHHWCPRDAAAPWALVCLVPSTTPEELRALGSYRQWKPDAQARALELLREREQNPWRPFYCPIPTCDGHPHGDSWTFEHARLDQRPPTWADDWLLWWLSGGRGSGKTRTGSEVTHQASNYTPRITLVGATGPDFRETMIEGVSGILATARPGQRPDWEPSKKKLTWPNGCVALGFSAEEPDRLRGPQGGFVWMDEPAHYDLAAQVWDNTLFGLRVKGKAKAKVIATSTPKSTKWVRERLDDERTRVTRVSTYANLANLADEFQRSVLDRYEGTRQGKQELYGELLEDVEGALWQWDFIHYIETAPDLVRIVVGVDPAGTTNKRSDETGIVVVGIDRFKNLYILHDATDKMSPAVWANRAHGAADTFAADCIVAEKNYGGDMVEQTLEKAGYSARVKTVTSRRGKDLRAEPIVALYEKHKVFHVGKRGDLAKLEDEMTSWVPGVGDSPNRVDALVHAATELARHAMPSTVASPTQLRNYRRGA